MKRSHRIFEMLCKDGYDAIFIVSKENVRYMSGFTGEDSYIILTSSQKKIFITDKRYIEQAEIECDDYEIVDWRYGSKVLAHTISDIVKENGIKTMAFESMNTNVDMYNSIQEMCESVKLVAVKEYIEELRYTKDDIEIDNIKKACEISDKALDMFYGFIEPGITEKEATSELEYYMKKLGADGVGFSTILLSGARSSLLHGIPSDKKIKKGDLLLIDFGARYRGYICDMTRTVVVGKADNKQKELYNIIKDAQRSAIDTMVANVEGTKPYRAIEKIVSDTEYMKYLYDGVGHGVGLSLHEQPFLGPKSIYEMKKNSVLTIEPGIYIPGWGGIRIEDMILIKEGTQEILTNTTRELIEL